MFHLLIDITFEQVYKIVNISSLITIVIYKHNEYAPNIGCIYK